MVVINGWIGSWFHGTINFRKSWEDSLTDFESSELRCWIEHAECWRFETSKHEVCDGWGHSVGRKYSGPLNSISEILPKFFQHLRTHVKSIIFYSAFICVLPLLISGSSWRNVLNSLPSFKRAEPPCLVGLSCKDAMVRDRQSTA